MIIDIDALVPRTEANQNFSKGMRLVDQTDLAITRPIADSARSVWSTINLRQPKQFGNRGWRPPQTNLL